jgi:hypothetical protein
MARMTGQGLLIIERILRDRDSIWRQVVEERGLKELTVQMLASSAASLAVYGAVLGASHSLAQAVSSAIKLPLLFLVTLAICLPTLYLFNLVFGARLSVVQAVALIMVSITVTSVLTLAFAPISLFFLITAHSYSFFKLLNVAILLLTALIGLRFLTHGMRALNDHQELVDRESAAEALRAAEAEETDGELAGAGTRPAIAAASGNGATVGSAAGGGAVGGGAVGGSATATATLPVATVPPEARSADLIGRPLATRPAAMAAQPASMTLLYIWILLFGFVGTQLAWTLRPFFGSPDEPFALFRNISGTFYSDIFTTIGRLLSG